MSNILVIDDEANNRLLLTIILEHAGHAVFEAANGIDGLRIARERLPDLVIVDLYMPEMNGASFIKALRADSEIGGVNVALYTGTALNDAMRAFMEISGIEHVIPKPGEPADILQSVREALG
jgi:CheY-like chemotaxis protein